MAGITKYHGATESELRSLSTGEKFAGLFAQQRLFPHSDTLRLETDRLILGSWLEVTRETVESFELEFTDAYSRFLAAGVRGSWATLGWIGDLGKPLIVRRTDNREPLYLLVEFRWLLGTTHNRRWYERLNRWLAASEVRP